MAPGPGVYHPSLIVLIFYGGIIIRLMLIFLEIKYSFYLSTFHSYLQNNDSFSLKYSSIKENVLLFYRETRRRHQKLQVHVLLLRGRGDLGQYLALHRKLYKLQTLGA